jgi:hypothetical protein
MRLVARPQACDKNAAGRQASAQKESVGLSEQELQGQGPESGEDDFEGPKRLRLWTQEATEPFPAGRPATDRMHSELRLHVATRRAGTQVGLYTGSTDRD